MAEDYLEKVRVTTKRRFESLRGELNSAAKLINGRACVYATGSFGRLEAGPESDLDLFIVVRTKRKSRSKEKERIRLLDGIAEIELKYHLIRAVDSADIAKFDGGGRYLVSHAIEDFVAALGSQLDDYQNTLTGRVLLLLESRVLLGESVYNELLDNVINAYFKDFEGKEDDFVPAFLINDILRLWRTFCVNYEFKRKEGSDENKIKNLKLKYSRMLTCYSAIIYLLSLYADRRTVSPSDVKGMVALTPLERLQHVRSANPLAGAERDRFERIIDKVLADYARFLKLMHKSKDELHTAYRADAEAWKKESYTFGQDFAEALEMLGRREDSVSNLYRMVLI